MSGKDLVERELHRGIPLWRIEDEMDWQENVVLSRKSVLLPETRGPTARGRSRWQPLLFLFGWLFNRVVHRVRFLR